MESHRHSEEIGIIGAGRLGSALGRSIAEADISIRFCQDADFDKAQRLAALLPGCRAIPSLSEAQTPATIVFAAVPDRSIAEVGKALTPSPLNQPGVIFVHCSGLWPARVWGETAPAFRAALHPVMLFTGSGPASLRDVPVSLEGDAEALPRLEALARSLGASPFRIAPEDKAAYHAACVMASNLLIGLLDAVGEVADAVRPDEGIAWLRPLIQATLDEASRLGTAQALTGPIVRGDADTVQRHIQALDKSHPQAVEIYRAISRRLMDMAHLGPAQRDAIRKALD